MARCGRRYCADSAQASRAARHRRALLAPLLLLLGCAGTPTVDDRFAPRIDDGVTSASYQIVKVSEGVIVNRIVEGDDAKRTFVTQEDLLAAIGRYRQRYAQPLPDDAFRDMANREEQLAAHRFLASRCDERRLLEVARYLEGASEPYTFTSHFGTQYDFDAPDRTGEADNLVITDFVRTSTTDDWSTYALLLRWIPTMHVGAARYRVRVEGEEVVFRSLARKKIWALSKRYWGYVKIYSTRNGRDRAPLLLQVEDPMNTWSDNGFYIVVPR
jgi:hypothetical protein